MMDKAMNMTQNQYFAWLGNAARLLLITAIPPLSGCITIAGDQLADVKPVPGKIRPAVQETVGAFAFHLDGGKMITSNKAGRMLNDEILDRWQESGFIYGHNYVEASNFPDASVYRITLSGHQEGDSSIFLQIISGLTLTAIPYYVDTKYNVHYSLQNARSGCVFEAEASDSFNTIVGLLMLPAAPFGQGGRSATYDRLANHLYAQLVEQGAFDIYEPCRDDGKSMIFSVEDRLKDADRLKSEGFISEEEYQKMRAIILKDSPLK